MQTFKILNENNHIILNVNGMRVLVDTGSPTSIASAPFSFMGKEYELPKSIMGIDTSKISSMSGFKIDVLLGNDILSKYEIRIRLAESAFDIGDEVPLGSVSSDMSTELGIPIIPIVINNNPVNAILDTGAHLSYIDPSFVTGRESFESKNDFYPTVGRFSVPIYKMPTRIGNYSREIEFGTLPESLQSTFGIIARMSNVKAIIGTQLFSYINCTFSCRQSKVFWEPI